MVDFSKLPDVSPEHPELSTEEERRYAAHMLARERALAHIFGESEPAGAILSPDDPDLNVNWPGGGVYQFPARAGRTGWHYATHGLAQPMGEQDEDGDDDDDDDDRVSGMGLEYVISAPGKSAWAPELLLGLVRSLLLTEEARLFLPGHRMPATALLQVGPGSQLDHLFGIESWEYPTQIMLPAGSCTLVHLVGATSAEIARAKAHGGGVEGTFVLAEVLRQLGFSPMTDPERACATNHPRFEALWKSVAEARSEENEDDDDDDDSDDDDE